MTTDSDQVAEATDPTGIAGWTFYDAWAAFPWQRVDNTERSVVGEFYVNTPGHGSGLVIRFYEWGDQRVAAWDALGARRKAARVLMFSDAWTAVAGCPELLAALAVLGRDDAERGPAEVRTALLAVGMTDITSKLRGTGRSPCPTCSGTGQLDDIGTSVIHRTPFPGGSGMTPCCDRSPFELPFTDRMSNDDMQCTCTANGVYADTPEEEA